MDPLSVTAGIIAILRLSGVVLGCLSNVKNASKEREKCAYEIINLQDLLFRLKLRIEGGDSTIPWALQELKDTMTQGGRLKTAGETLLWKFKKEEIDRISTQMQSLKSVIEIALQNDHFKLSLAIQNTSNQIDDATVAIKDDTGYLRNGMTRVFSNFEILHQDRDNTQFEKVMAWLSPIDPSIQHADVIRRKQKGTGHWFIEHPQFKNLLRNPHETLFCSGIPGAGKTMITAIAIEHISRSVADKDTGIAYLYCNYKEQDTHTVDTLLATLLRQLLTPQCLEHAQELYEKHAEKRTRPNVDEIIEVACIALSKLKTAYIVMDALDECSNDDNNRHKLLTQLRLLQRKSDLRLMATSRLNIPDIDEEFRDATKMEIHAQEEDVRRFIVGQFERLPDCIQHDEDLKLAVQNKVTDASAGMFLLTRLHVESLLDKRTKRKVINTLEALQKDPEALKNAYSAALERIKSQLFEDAKLPMKVLCWITCAKRPLTTTELCHALAVEEDCDSLDEDNIPSIRDILAVCAGFVNVDEKSDVIRLVHYTAQEYFDRIRETLYPGTHLDIALTCLRTLSFKVLRSGACATDADFEARLGRIAFLNYAVQYWGHHSTSFQAEVFHIVRAVLLDQKTVSSMVQVDFVVSYRTQSERYSEIYPRTRIGLQIVADFGLEEIYKKLLSETGGNIMEVVNQKDNYEVTALLLAAGRGHEAMMTFLLAEGADPNIQCGFYGNALYWTSEQGKEQAVQLLLDNGAKVNAQGGFYGYALQAAARIGNTTIVQMLLEKGADMNATGGSLATALIAAVISRNEPLVKLLLDAGADVNIEGGYYNSALQAACIANEESMIRLLLEKGARVNPAEGSERSALCSASWNGNAIIVQLLLDKGADVNTSNKHDWTPLDAACGNGFSEIAKILLDNGANPNAQSDAGGTALIRACVNGHTQTVQILLDNGANLSLEDKGGLRALEATAITGRIEVLHLLIDRGAPLSPSSLGQTALASAAASDQYQFVKALLQDEDAYTIMNGHMPFYGTIMHLLAFKGYLDLVRWTHTQYPGSMHMTDSHHRNPLHFAALGGNLKTFQYLFKLGFDVTSEDAKGADVLCYAATGGSVEIVEEIVTRHSEVSEKTKNWTLLHWACRSGKPEVVKMLLSRGVRSHWTTISGHRWSPLAIALFHGHQGMVSLELGDETGIDCPGKRHEVLCDGCSLYIYGTRFKCLNCHDLDYCFMCKPILEGLHEGHKWDEMEVDSSQSSVVT